MKWREEDRERERGGEKKGEKRREEEREREEEIRGEKSRKGRYKELVKGTTENIMKTVVSQLHSRHP